MSQPGVVLRKLRTILSLCCSTLIPLSVVSQDAPPCPSDAQLIPVAESLTCLCPPGQYYLNGICNTFQIFDKGLPVNRTYKSFFNPDYDLSANGSKKSRVESIFLITSVVIIVIWVALTCSLRLLPMYNGNYPGGGLTFKLRYFVSRLDRRYHRKHWMDEQKVLVKRRTELGGICSGSSYVFTVGIFLGLTVQQFGNGSRISQSLVVNSGRELAGFDNYLMWNITAVSAMDCSQFQVTSATFDSELFSRPLTAADIGAEVRCEDGIMGPSVLLTCPNCRATSDLYNIYFEFTDRPGMPAMATGFEFEFLASESNNSVSRESRCRGAVRASGSLRGQVENVFWFQGIPRQIKDAGGLKLIQATLHQFLEGSVLDSADNLTASVRNSSEPLKVALQMEILSDYIIVTEKVFMTFSDIVTWLSAMGGAYLLGLSLFYLLQLQGEIHLRGLAYDNELMEIAQRVFHRQKLWRKVRAAMVTLQVLKYWKKYKAKYEEEDRVLIQAMEAQQKQREEEAQLAIQQVEDSHWLRRLVSLPTFGRSASAITNRQLHQATPPVTERSNSHPSQFQGLTAVGGFVSEAAQSLGAAAASVRPRIPHMTLFSGQFPGPRPPLGHSASNISNGTATAQEEEEQKQKKKSKSYKTYGSNTTYVGSVVREYRKPSWLVDEDRLPAVPCLEEEIKDDEEIEWEDLIHHAASLQQYNDRMRRDFLAFQSMIENTLQYFRPHSDL